MFTRKSNVRRRERGLTMMELIIAMTILAVGLAGVMILLTGAIASNNRNKLDSTATVLSQMMVERLIAAGTNASSTFSITDCQSNSLSVDPTGSTAGRGAPLTSTGDINFSGTLSPSTGYSINYVTCRAGDSTATYNIRWNIKILQGTASQPVTKQITVSTRQIGASGTGANQLQFFALPVTLRTVVAN